MIKLVIVDYYGVILTGSYKNTAEWIAKKYKLKFNDVYKVIYHKYFLDAVNRKITEKQSFDLAAHELGIKESGAEVRRKHLSFQKLNRPVVRLCEDLQKKGVKIVLLSQNTPPQFKEKFRQLGINKYFKNIINTYDLRAPKSSLKVLQYVLGKFKVKPHETVMIDDQAFNLVTAKKIGIKAILYKNLGKKKAGLEDFFRIFLAR